MVGKNLVKVVLSLSIESRLELFYLLRQNLLNDPAIDVLTDEEKQLLSKRMGNSTPDDFSPWEEVDARLLALLKDRR